MFLTIAIPTYNRKHTLTRCLKSLEIQNFKDFEVIIIDDGSVDDTESFILDYQKKTSLNLKYYKKKNGGKYTAINKALDYAEGEYFLILDSDDWLTEYAVQTLNLIISDIESDSEICGVIGKCENSFSGEVIGDKFVSDYISYLEMHFPKRRNSKNFGDCCEINKTTLLKQFKFPELNHVKFIPESYMFDQLGLTKKLICTNSVLKIVEYQENDGITLNKNFKLNNIEGYLVNYKLRIERIIPHLKYDKYFYLFVAWWRFWDAYEKIDKSNRSQYKSERFSFFGYLVKLLKPIINIYYKRKYPDLYSKGR